MKKHETLIKRTVAFVLAVLVIGGDVLPTYAAGTDIEDSTYENVIISEDYESDLEKLIVSDEDLDESLSINDEESVDETEISDDSLLDDSAEDDSEDTAADDDNDSDLINVEESDEAVDEESETEFDTEIETDIISFSDEELASISPEAYFVTDLSAVNNKIDFNVAAKLYDENDKESGYIVYKTFENFRDAVKYIDEMNNMTADMVIYSEKASDINFDETLVMPKNAKSIKIELPENTKVIYSGDVTIYTDTVLKNFNVQGVDGNAAGALKLNGKNFTLENSKVKFTSIGGDNAGTSFSLVDSSIEATGSVKLLGDLIMFNGSLDVDGALELNNIFNRTSDDMATPSSITTGSTFVIKGRVSNEWYDRESVIKEICNNYKNHSPERVLKIYKKNMLGEPVEGVIIIDECKLVANSDLIFVYDAKEYSLYKKNNALCYYEMNMIDIGTSTTHHIIQLWEVSNYTASEYTDYIEYQNNISDKQYNDKEWAELKTLIENSRERYRGYYDTLQDVFDEIENEGSIDKVYEIVVYANDIGSLEENLVTPKNAGFIKISSRTSGISLNFNNSIELGCGLQLGFDYLDSNTNNYTINLKGNCLYLSEGELDDDRSWNDEYCKIVGDSSTGSSTFISNAEIPANYSSIENVGKVSINEEDVRVDGNLSAGTVLIKNSTVVGGKLTTSKLIMDARESIPIVAAVNDNTIGDIVINTGTTTYEPRIYVGLNEKKDSIGKVTGTIPKTKVTGNITYNGSILEIVPISPERPINYDLSEILNYTYPFYLCDWIDVLNAPKVNDVSNIKIGLYKDSVSLCDFTLDSVGKSLGNIVALKGTDGMQYELYSLACTDIDAKNYTSAGKAFIGKYKKYTDVVNEINKIGVKQNYYILVKGTTIDDSNVTALTMPNAGCVNKLVIEGETDDAELRYTGTITLNTDTMLRNIKLTPGSLSKTGFVPYAQTSAQTINVNGKTLYISKKVVLNNDTNLTGKNGNLVVMLCNDDGWDYVSGLYDVNHISDSCGIDIAGSVTGFDKIAVYSPDRPIIVKLGYKSSALSLDTNTLDIRGNISGTGKTPNAEVIVDNDTNATNDKLSVKKALYINQATIKVSGSIDLYDVSIEEDTDADNGTKISADTAFNIKGDLTVSNSDVLLETRIKENKAGSIPYLNISGNVDTESPIKVKCLYPANSGITKDYQTKGYLDTGDNYVHTNVVLTAKNGAPSDFRFVSDDTDRVDISTDIFNSICYSSSPYAFVKIGDTIRFQYILEDIQVIVVDKAQLNPANDLPENTSLVRFGGLNADAIIGYYTSFSDATAAVDKLNNKTADYVMVLMSNTVDAKGNPMNIKFPVNAKSVEVAGYYSPENEDMAARRSLVFNNDFKLNTDTIFRNINLVPAGKGKMGPIGKNHKINTGKYNLDISNKVTVGITPTSESGAFVFTDSDKCKIGTISGQAKSGSTVNLKNLVIDGNISGIDNLDLYDCEITGTVNCGNLNVAGTCTFDKSVKATGDLRADKEGNNEVIAKDALTIEGVVSGQSANPLLIKVNAGKLSCYTIISVKIYIQDKSCEEMRVSDSADYNKLELKGKELFYLKSDMRTGSKSDGGFRTPNEYDMYFNGTKGYNLKFAKSGGAVYCYDANSDIKNNIVTAQVKDSETSVIDLCAYLDINSAFADLKNISGPQKDVIIYYSNSTGDIVTVDANVTGDNTLYSDIKFPDNSKGNLYKSLRLDCNDSYVDIASPNSKTYNLYGDVSFNNVGFVVADESGKGDLTLAAKADKNGISKIVFDYEIFSKLGYCNSLPIKQINGIKGKTQLQFIYADLDMSGGFKDIDELKVGVSDLLTRGVSVVADYYSDDWSEWVMYGKTTIDTIYYEKNKDEGTEYGVYLSVYHDKKGIPSLTVNNDFIAGDSDSRLYISSLNNWSKMVLAKKMAESKVRYKVYSYVYDLVKDAEGYIYFDISEPKKINVQFSADGKSYYYATDLNEAFKQIDTINNPSATYTIELLNAHDDTHKDVVHFSSTVKKNGKDVPGTVKLPSKAAKIIIKPEVFAENYTDTILFSGKFEAKTDVELQNVYFSEYKQDVSGNITAADKVDITIAKGKTLTLNNSATSKERKEINLTSLNASSATFVISGKYTDLNCAGKFNAEKFENNCDNDINVKVKSASTIGKGGITGTKTIKWFNIRNGKDVTKTLNPLTVNGPIKAPLNINICAEDKSLAGGVRALTDTEKTKVVSNVNDKPAESCKLFTSPAVGMDGIKWNTDLGSTSSSNIVKYNKALYAYDGNHISNSDVQVIGSLNDDRTTTFYPTWELAVKAIDLADWYVEETVNGKKVKKYADYTIVLRRDLGSESTPLTSLNMPSKVNSLSIEKIDTGDLETRPQFISIYTTANTVSLKSNTSFDGVYIESLKKGKINYEENGELTMNVGNYSLEAVLYSGNISKTEPDFTPWNVKGSASGKFTLYNRFMEYEYDLVSQITGVGTVEFVNEASEDLEVNQTLGGGTGGNASVSVKKSITGVNKLIIDRYIIFSCTDLSVKNLEIKSIQTPTVFNDCFSRIIANNVTVSDTLYLERVNYLDIYSGSDKVGDGKITIGNIQMIRTDGMQSPDNNDHLNLYGKVDKNGNSLISINGEFTYTTGEDGKTYFTSYSSNIINIGLSPCNIISGEDKLIPAYEGLKLANAPKIPTCVVHSLIGENIKYKNGNNRYMEYKSDKGIYLGILYTPGLDHLFEANVLSKNKDCMIYCSDYLTYEDAVKDIDNLNNMNGDYVISLKKDVELGNDKGDGAYNTLLLPQKAQKVTVDGNYTNYTIRYKGDITLKCNVKFDNVNLQPMKQIKEAGKSVGVPTTGKINVGNYNLELSNIITKASDDTAIFSSISGTKKGSLKLRCITTDKTERIDGITLGEIKGFGEVDIYTINDTKTMYIKSLLTDKLSITNDTSRTDSFILYVDNLSVKETDTKNLNVIVYYKAKATVDKVLGNFKLRKIY